MKVKMLKILLIIFGSIGISSVIEIILSIVKSSLDKLFSLPENITHSWLTTLIVFVLILLVSFKTNYWEKKSLF